MVKKIGHWYLCHFLDNLKDINNDICFYASVSDYQRTVLGNKEEESKEGEEKHEIKAEGHARHEDSLERDSMSSQHKGESGKVVRP